MNLLNSWITHVITVLATVARHFVEVLKCDVGDMAVDVFFWFDYSTKKESVS